MKMLKLRISFAKGVRRFEYEKKEKQNSRVNKMVNGVTNGPICVHRSEKRTVHHRDTQWAARIHNAQKAIV